MAVTATTADSESRLVNVSLYTRNTVAETGRVHIEYVDEDGNVLASDSITGAIGASYTTTAIAIDGYTVKTIPANASGTHTSADIFITYVYSKVEDNTGDNNSNPDSSPVTGDESHTYIWLLVMIMGALGIVMTRNKYFDTRD